MRACRCWSVAVWSLAFAEALAVPLRAERATAAEPGATTAPVPGPGTAPSLPLAANPVPLSAPVPGAPGTPAASPAAVRAPLPSYFTVEVGPNGALFADGSALGNAAELEPLARTAAASGSFAGAVLFADGRAGAAADEAAGVLRRVGFGTLIEARRSAPPELSPLRGAERERAERERARQARQRLIAAGIIEGDAPAPSASRPAAAPVAAAPVAAARPRAPAVELQTVGLYLSGPSNTDATRRQLVKLFERSFPAFRRCHGDAGEHSENLSFGVDLLVPKEGGSAKVRQTRTRLTGTTFKTCMERVFQGIRFEPLPSARPEIVSYSVLFRPEKR
jgi:hypothetical protein